MLLFLPSFVVWRISAPHFGAPWFCSQQNQLLLSWWGFQVSFTFHLWSFSVLSLPFVVFLFLLQCPLVLYWWPLCSMISLSLFKSTSTLISPSEKLYKWILMIEFSGLQYLSTSISGFLCCCNMIPFVVWRRNFFTSLSISPLLLRILWGSFIEGGPQLWETLKMTFDILVAPGSIAVAVDSCFVGFSCPLPGRYRTRWNEGLLRDHQMLFFFSNSFLINFFLHYYSCSQLAHLGIIVNSMDNTNYIR